MNVFGKAISAIEKQSLCEVSMPINMTMPSVAEVVEAAKAVCYR